MNEPRGWVRFAESHLMPDAVVAFVDGELSLGAQDRAASHIARCPGCTAEVAAQRQARAAVKGAAAPPISAGFLASLRAIPQHTDLPTAPDNLAVTEDGQLVAVQRPDRVAGFRAHSTVLGSSSPLGTATPLGRGSAVLAGQQRAHSVRRRAAQGAGVVVSGLVLSALAIVVTSSGDGTGQVPQQSGGNPPGVLRAQFGGIPEPATPTTTTSENAAPLIQNR
ncbi:MAG TPA: zf-HC2 domain-containing protein [Amycolatopsis sp.]|uniref:zf-HC2 domain-containing protein n=1 Tax=Amycolatopsis sp. TaxID=37632 RepID=UPI002B4A992E|nr:zf-HC2 domain-containing protein [Amycolatopsis sp.]HKS45514.1 zf-HC2 domain-containing protein [Amycolatopsis sp.]